MCDESDHPEQALQLLRDERRTGIDLFGDRGVEDDNSEGTMMGSAIYRRILQTCPSWVSRLTRRSSHTSLGHPPNDSTSPLDEEGEMHEGSGGSSSSSSSTHGHHHRPRPLSDLIPKHGPLIHRLDLNRAREWLTDGSLIALSQQCTQLRSLNVSRCTRLTDRSILALANHCGDTLTSINFSECPGVSESAWLSLASKVPHLKAASWIGCTDSITNPVISALASTAHHLASLRIGLCVKVSDVGIIALAEGCSRMRWLDISKCTWVTDKGIKALANKCLDLEWLDASGIDFNSEVGFRFRHILPPSEISDDSVSLIVERCRNLRLLNLSNCARLTDSTILAIAEHCLNLKSLTISGCRRITTTSIMRLGSDRIGWVGMSPCPNVSFPEVCKTANWKVINTSEVPQFHLQLMGGQSWEDVGTA